MTVTSDNSAEGSAGIVFDQITASQVRLAYLCYLCFNWSLLFKNVILIDLQIDSFCSIRNTHLTNCHYSFFYFIFGVTLDGHN